MSTADDCRERGWKVGDVVEGPDFVVEGMGERPRRIELRQWQRMAARGRLAGGPS